MLFRGASCGGAGLRRRWRRARSAAAPFERFGV